MSLILSQVGEEVKIKKITGNSETKKFLNSLGFVIGEGITIVSSLLLYSFICKSKYFFLLNLNFV